MRIYADGAVIQSSKVGLEPTTEAVLFGYGLFETLRVSDGHAMYVEAHVERILNGCKQLGLKPDVDAERLRDACVEVIRRNALRGGSLRIQILQDGSNTRTIVSPRDEEAVAFCPESAWSVRTVVDEVPSRFLRGTKCSNYLRNILALREAKAEGFDEVIFVTPNDVVTEGAMTNVFWVRDGALFTPSVETGILPGILRARVLELAGNAAVEGAYPASDLNDADEVFVTNSVRGILPVGQVDGESLASAKVPGPLTQKLMGALRDDARASRG